MKTFRLVALILFSLAIFIPCEEETENDSSHTNIQFINNESGGCNGQQMNIKSALIENKDTIHFSIEENKLNIFVGINYLCCAPFSSTTEIENDTIKLIITDDCKDGNYCRCNCYYTWNFYFEDFEEKTYHYMVIFKNPQATEPIIFREGDLDITSIN